MQHVGGEALKVGQDYDQRVLRVVMFGEPVLQGAHGALALTHFGNLFIILENERESCKENRDSSFSRISRTFSAETNRFRFVDKLMHRVLDDASHVVPISAPQDGDVRRQLAELRHRRVEKRRVIGNVDSYIRCSSSLTCIKTR